MNIFVIRWLLLSILIVVMAGCKTTRKTSQIPRQAATFSAEDILKHEQAVRGQANWSFQGRVAFKQGNDGGSAHIDWLQRGDTLRVDLSAPISRKSVQISAINGLPMCIDGLAERRLCGDEAQEQLSWAIGEMPLLMLQDWVRGISADNALDMEIQPPIMRYNDDGQLQKVLQQGWQIDYQTWHPATNTQPSLPKRLQALKDDIRLRLIIDRWTWGDDEPH